jgi:hypothetical protein
VTYVGGKRVVTQKLPRLPKQAATTVPPRGCAHKDIPERTVLQQRAAECDARA